MHSALLFLALLSSAISQSTDASAKPNITKPTSDFQQLMVHPNYIRLVPPLHLRQETTLNETCIDPDNSASETNASLPLTTPNAMSTLGELKATQDDNCTAPTADISKMSVQRFVIPGKPLLSSTPRVPEKVDHKLHARQFQEALQTRFEGVTEVKHVVLERRRKYDDEEPDYRSYGGDDDWDNEKLVGSDEGDDDSSDGSNGNSDDPNSNSDDGSSDDQDTGGDDSGEDDGSESDETASSDQANDDSSSSNDDDSSAGEESDQSESEDSNSDSTNTYNHHTSIKAAKSNQAAKAAAARAVRSAECERLRTIYADMGGQGWVRQNGWNNMSAVGQEIRCCGWSGVVCNRQGRVTALDLAGNGLVGKFSWTTFQLNFITRLNLSNNNIDGTLWDGFYNMTNLAVIYLDSNNFSGKLPYSLLNASTLVSLRFSNNSFDGEIGFPNAANLTQLYAAHNHFTQLDLQNPKLLKIAVEDNNFSGQLPNLATMPGLQYFAAARNQFAGSVGDISQLKNLTKLDLQNNQLTGNFPDPTNLPALRFFAINGNSFTGPFPVGSSPASLVICHVDPMLQSSCPSPAILQDPTSLASKCAVKCRGGGQDQNAAVSTQTKREQMLQDNTYFYLGGGAKRVGWNWLAGCVVLMGFML